MAKAFLSFIEELKGSPAVEAPLEPNLDDHAGPEGEDESKMMDSEVRALEKGGVLKGLIREGDPDSGYPARGDMVVVHLTLRPESSEDVLESTEAAYGGSGLPRVFLLGKGCQALRGWELALLQMARGERAVFKIKPELAYAHPSCPAPPPPGAAPRDTLRHELELVDWSKGAEAIDPEHSAFKVVVTRGAGWETPRAPFEVSFAVTARVRGGGGGALTRELFHCPTTEPLTATVGSGDIPGGLEEGLCAMCLGERAVITLAGAVPRAGRLVPGVAEGAEGVEFEATLLSMVQVRDMTGDGGVMKKRAREGQGEFPIDCPLEDCEVRVHYVARRLPGGEVIKDTRAGGGGPETFLTGTASAAKALDMAVRLMLPGELSVGQMGDAEKEKEIANGLFKGGEYALARDKYRKVLRLLDEVSRHGVEGAEGGEEEGMRRLNVMRCTLMLNAAQCDFKEGAWLECIKACSKVLEADPYNAKALFRRGMAQMGRGAMDEAQADFEEMPRADPSAAEDSKGALAKLARAREAGKLEERRQYKGMLDKKKEIEAAKRAASSS